MYYQVHFEHFSFSSPFLHFGVRTTIPITDLEFTVTDCKVYSDSDTQNPDTKHYVIMTNKCPNTRVNFQIYRGNDYGLTTFSFTVFEFRRAVEKSLLHLICSVVVCDINDQESVCKEPGVNCDSNRGQKKKKTEKRAKRESGHGYDNGPMYYQVRRSYGAV